MLNKILLYLSLFLGLGLSHNSFAYTAKKIKFSGYDISVSSKLKLTSSAAPVRKLFPYMVVNKITKDIALIESNNMKSSDCTKETKFLKDQKIAVTVISKKVGKLNTCRLTYKTDKGNVVQIFYFKPKQKRTLSITATSRATPSKSLVSFVEGIQVK